MVCGKLRVSRCDLQRAEFYRADIKEAHFTECDFSLCSFEGASLFGADLTGSRFRAVTFGTTTIEGTTVDRVSFALASIAHKSFRKQRLVGVDFSEAVFEDCRIENPIVSPETTFDGADLRGARLTNLRLDVARATAAVISQSQAAGFLHDTYGVLVVEG